MLNGEEFLFCWSRSARILDVGNGDSFVGSSYWTMNWGLRERYCVCVCVTNKTLFKDKFKSFVRQPLPTQQEALH